jgi:hypothetical protein
MPVMHHLRFFSPTWEDRPVHPQTPAGWSTGSLVLFLLPFSNQTWEMLGNPQSKMAVYSSENHRTSHVWFDETKG